MIHQKYEDVFSEINLEIQKFNELLAEEFKIPLLNSSNPESFAILINDVHWKDQDCLPDRLNPGVYILCAYCQSAPNSLGVYIGKSSVKNRHISSRLSTHLQRHNANGSYQGTDKSGKTYIYEAVVVIALRNDKMRTLAPALEEFIITGVKERVHLLNGTGN